MGFSGLVVLIVVLISVQVFGNEWQDFKNDINRETVQQSIKITTNDQVAAGLGVGAIVGIVIGSLVCLIGCCVCVCRVCCGCCQKSTTVVHTTVVTPPSTSPQTNINFGFPSQQSAPYYTPVSQQTPADGGLANPMYGNAPPPQYSSK